MDLETFRKLAVDRRVIPVSRRLLADGDTPVGLYRKLAAERTGTFLLESAENGRTWSRFSFIGVRSAATLTVRDGQAHWLGTPPVGVPLDGDPLHALRATVETLHTPRDLVGDAGLPPFTGGMVGYLGYDVVRRLEKITEHGGDDLELPELTMLLTSDLAVLDHGDGTVLLIANAINHNDLETGVDEAYAEACRTIDELVDVLDSPDVPLPEQGPIELGKEYTSNVGQAGYEAHVTRLKEHIVKGDIIQAVPSQRFARPTSLHPFNIYRHLRTVNPSPYLFYVDCKDFQIVGASPELLVKSEDGRVITPPIAGTVKRGRTPEEDVRLADELRASLKDRAEHVMLVDLARNDVNRVADPRTVRVDRLMVVEKFSHVQHLVSQVSGVLRPGQTRFDAFRSIFPAGTVSGAPKVKAMELIAELEREKRGVYAGAVGYFGYGGLGEDGEPVEGAMDTCIALRTMMVKDGVAYLQAGKFFPLLFLSLLLSFIFSFFFNLCNINILR